MRWCAPEVLEQGKYSFASDVWAYGVLLYELYTSAETPYTDWGNEKVWKEVTGGYRLPCPPRVPPEMYDIMSNCWEMAAQARPSMKVIVGQLRDLQDSLDIYGASAVQHHPGGGRSRVSKFQGHSEGLHTYLPVEEASEEEVNRFKTLAAEKERATSVTPDRYAKLYPMTLLADPDVDPELDGPIGYLEVDGEAASGLTDVENTLRDESVF